MRGGDGQCQMRCNEMQVGPWPPMHNDAIGTSSISKEQELADQDRW